MDQLKITYFDIDGGRAEPARLALHIGGIAFEDHRFAFGEFAAVRKTTPLNQVPTLQVNDVQVTQSGAITRYVGRLSGLYPEDAFQAMLCDEIMDGVEDVSIKLGTTFGLAGDDLKIARTDLVNGVFPKYLRWLQNQLESHGGEYFAASRLTIADLKVFVFIRGLNSGNLDHVPTNLVETVAPKLNAHMQRIAQMPAIVQHYAKSTAA
ncbi:glutathione S-transferase family protein [Propionivibrio sp.]|uniref:glutathione S-transferase family protein n=1 Tax=Propionivibrio sp. TaxID=2212460 RepID=UPI00261D2DA3|nr:glutathione S-transferase family protein [Propionivibrio sp.]